MVVQNADRDNYLLLLAFLPGDNIVNFAYIEHTLIKTEKQE